MPVAAVVTVLAGIALGALDFAFQKTLPYPWANLANSSAVWAVAAFALGYWIFALGWIRKRGLRGATAESGPREASAKSGLRGAIAGAAMLVIAVPSYYATATLVQQDDVANIWSSTSLLWMGFGLLAGAVFGAAGVWAHATGWQRIVATALPGAVLLAEAARLGHRGEVGTAVIEAALGVLVIMVVGRTARQRIIALGVAVPLAALGFVGFAVAGFA